MDVPQTVTLPATYSEPPVLVIKPSSGWSSLALHEVWEYRELAYYMLTREIRGRYRQMALGPLWIVLGPLLSIAMNSIIFGTLAKLPSDGIPYPLFNFAGLLPWTFFTSALMASANSLLNSRGLISKVYFPRLIIPIVGVLSNLVDFTISFVIFLGMMLAYGYAPGWGIVLVPVMLLVAALTGMAVGLWVSSWIVHYRDVSTLLGYVTRFWMYATPIVYAASVIPDRWMPLYKLNPMTNIVEGFRWALLGQGRAPDVYFLVSTLLMLPILVSGLYYFRRTERNIIDIA
ncbi:MAG TPA: ABC transporter permease [Aggregatilinea sp.]|jgi:lipopolysaccharide transport system permease protein|uniref:ABC transporter permease n=1 Tax=Aggregatilinea sp. TaxID=2806333 RepID=UPI002C31861F|nr:ABC transporter permease [Aggregatilinea sp.]HML23958.1 ABC transporter permease [Aggregatilinea sp.]